MGDPRGTEEMAGAVPPFAGLLGQAKAKAFLCRALAAGRIPHAYLFRGPEGVGKRLFAARMAANLNCSLAQNGAACGMCPTCRKFRSGNHPDFLVVGPEQGSIKIDRIRELIKALSYPPYESAMRVVLLEDVHTMRREAANCLLKTLEEPPENNLLILTAESSRAILPTIASRCQIVPFFPLPIDDTVSILKGEGLDEEAAGLLARLSEGSPGRALLFRKTEMAETREQVTAAICGATGDEQVGALLQMAERMAGLKENLLPFLGILRIWVRDRLMAASGPGGSGGFFAMLAAIDRAEQELVRNCNRTLVCEILLFRLQEAERKQG
jgi:DNA polymerase-3 subunit delta'